MKALMIVDPQNDFCPGGALGVAEGDVIMSGINDISEEYNLILISREQHPANHKSFITENPGSQVLDVVDGLVMWPPHCIKDTFGAKFHDDLKIDDFAIILTKGEERELHPFSAFEAVDEDGFLLTEILKEHAVDEIDVCGLATDYCVKDTVLDAIKDPNIKTVRLLAHLSRGVAEDTTESAIDAMEKSGAIIVND